MFKDKNTEKLFKRVKRLRQRDEVWEVSLRRARVWVGGKDETPRRPDMLMMVDRADGSILRSEIKEHALSAEAFFFELLQGMRSPAWFAGGKRRPSTIYVDNADYVATLSPWFAQLNVACEYRPMLPVVDQVMVSMEKQINPGGALPGLLKIRGMTPPLIEHIYALAGEFYQLAPWRWMDDDSPFEIRFPTNSRSRYAVVMGSNATIFGLAVYDSLDDLQDALSYPIDTSDSSAFVLHFNEMTAMNFDDLDAMEKYGWTVVGDWAYPIFFRAKGHDEVEPPRPQDMFWLEGALSAIVPFIRDKMRAQGYRVWPAELTMPVATISGEKDVYLQVPADV
ncbi:MAG: DUF6930 domain-containing protein [Ardenticatenaceae bacterium]